MPVPSGREIGRVAEHPVCTPRDQMRDTGADLPAASRTHVALLRLEGRHRLDVPFDAPAKLHASPAREEPVEAVLLLLALLAAVAAGTIAAGHRSILCSPGAPEGLTRSTIAA